MVSFQVKKQTNKKAKNQKSRWVWQRQQETAQSIFERQLGPHTLVPVMSLNLLKVTIIPVLLMRKLRSEVGKEFFQSHNINE